MRTTKIVILVTLSVLLSGLGCFSFAAESSYVGLAPKERASKPWQ